MPSSGGCLVLGLPGGGVPGPGGCLVLRGVPGGDTPMSVHSVHRGGHAWSGGRGCLVLGWVPGPGGVPGGDTPRQLLLRAVRILLECILVLNTSCYMFT